VKGKTVTDYRTILLEVRIEGRSLSSEKVREMDWGWGFKMGKNAHASLRGQGRRSEKKSTTCEAMRNRNTW